MLSVAIYDPRRLSEDDFLAGFVAREDLANFLLNQLRGQARVGDLKHRLLIGQRGMGKTSLLRRIEIGIIRDKDLASRYLPLSFREEQYNVRSIEFFWRNCAEALAEVLERCGDVQGATEIDRELSTGGWADPQKASEAWLAKAQSKHKIPVLLVDNIDLVLNALPSDQHWQLRRVLQARNGAVLYGAATQFPSQLVDRESAFYEFFQVHQLEPLTEGELLHCLNSLANARAELGRPVIEILTRQPERLRVIHKLTGGNPRVLALVYQILERQESDTVFSDLEVLLDQVTPFYKARVEELNTELQRAILDAIALHWDPVTSNKLSKDTDIEITTISSQLSRFRNQGLIEEVSTSGSRSGYQLIERFFNIWYLMRHGTRRTRQKVQWLTRFLSSFYSAEELRQIGNRHGAADQWSPLYAQALAAALEECEGNDRAMLSHGSIVDQAKEKVGARQSRSLRTLRDIAKRSPNDPNSWTNLFFRLMELGKLQEAEAAIRRVVDDWPTIAQAWSSLGILLARENRLSEAELAFRKAVELRPDDEGARVSLIYALHDLERFADGEAVCRQGIERNEKSDRLWFELGHYLHYHEEQPADAEKAYKRAIDLKPHWPQAWTALGEVLNYLGRHEEAEHAQRTAIELDPENGTIWCNLATALHRLNRNDEAEAAYKQALNLDPKHGRSWNAFGSFWVNLERFDAAESAYRQATELAPDVPFAWANLASLLHHCQRFTEAETVCRQAIERGAANANIWGNLGELLHHHLERTDEAEGAYRRAIEIGPERAHYWRGLGAVLTYLNRYDEAEVALRKGIQLNPDDGGSWFYLGQVLQRLDRNDEAEGAYRRAIEIHPADSDTWDVLAKLYYDLGRHDEAEATFRKAIDLKPQDCNLWGQFGDFLYELGRYKDAEACYRQAVEIDQNDARFRHDLLWSLLALGRLSEARVVRSQIVELDASLLGIVDAALQISKDNFGGMAENLTETISNAEPLARRSFGPLIRLFRLVAKHGYGEHFIAWFRENGHDVRYAPLFAAFVASLRGEPALLDFSPEVRSPATELLRRIKGGREVHVSEKVSQRQGRRRRRGRSTP
jgi:tetratricopeptide (TPR) repeat protein